MILLRDARLGDAQLVHAPFNRLARLHHGFVPEIRLDVRPHRERVDAGAAGAAIEVGLDFRGRLTERRVLRGRHPFDAELRRTHGIDLRHQNVACLQLRAQPLHFGFGLDAQGIVGLDAEDEVYAAFEIEPELELLLLQPTG
ncbi:MAG: hypothetical protein DMF98_17265 [Acidobacteria bacterium]|nr:MAG: hypothetical protein DMF98_17265 [Acidobacteriota bacterium]